MNKDYNKHREIAIVLFMIIAAILVACNMDRNKDKQTHPESNGIYDTCGIDSAYVEDSLHQTYDEVKVDTQGHVYHITIK